jgi:hypothetical protein
MKREERSSIQNAIWLCQNHAKAIDDDHLEWSSARLHQIKRDHERDMRAVIGIPRNVSPPAGPAQSTPREFAFVVVGALVPAYKAVLAPMLQDRNLGDNSELGILMIGSPVNGREEAAGETPWTVFVEPNWLKWVLKGQGAGFGLPGEVPPRQIYGKIPEWPDNFLQFLAAIVETGTSFEWQRTRNGYLALAQRSIGA